MEHLVVLLHCSAYEVEQKETKDDSRCHSHEMTFGT